MQRGDLGTSEAPPAGDSFALTAITTRRTACWRKCGRQIQEQQRSAQIVQMRSQAQVALARPAV